MQGTRERDRSQGVYLEMPMEDWYNFKHESVNMIPRAIKHPVLSLMTRWAGASMCGSS